MTRDKIIEGLKSILAQDIYWEDDVAVMQEAITALQAQDVDAVSRQAVMWMLTNLSYTQCRTQGEVEVIGLAKTMLIAMPSAQEVNNSNQEVNNSTATQSNSIKGRVNMISRQAAIEALYNVLFDDDLKPTIVTAKQADIIMDSIRWLPSAQPDNSCDGCKYENADDGVLVPCGFCKRSHPDNYERRTDG